MYNQKIYQLHQQLKSHKNGCVTSQLRESVGSLRNSCLKNRNRRIVEKFRLERTFGDHLVPSLAHDRDTFKVNSKTFYSRVLSIITVGDSTVFLGTSSSTAQSLKGNLFPHFLPEFSFPAICVCGCFVASH